MINFLLVIASGVRQLAQEISQDETVNCTHGKQIIMAAIEVNVIASVIVNEAYLTAILL